METGALILINDVELVSRLFIQGKVTGPGPGLNDLSNIERVAFDEFRTIAGPHGKGEIAFHPKRGPGLGHLSGLVKERRIGIAMDLLFSRAVRHHHSKRRQGHVKVEDQLGYPGLGGHNLRLWSYIDCTGETGGAGGGAYEGRSRLCQGIRLVVADERGFIPVNKDGLVGLIC